jgi:hypothetical protein
MIDDGVHCIGQETPDYDKKKQSLTRTLERAVRAISLLQRFSYVRGNAPKNIVIWSCFLFLYGLVGIARKRMVYMSRLACVTASTPPNSPQTPNVLRHAMGTQRRGPLRKQNNALRVRYNLAHDIQRPHLLRSSAIRGGQYLTRNRL